MLKGRLLVPVALALLMVTSSASADQASVVDTQNPDQAMDPVEATHGHSGDLDDVLVHTVLAREPWHDGDLYKLELRMWFPNKTATWDRKIVVTLNDIDEESRSSWQALFKDKRGRIRGHANAWRSNDRSLRIEFSRRLLPMKFDSYRWVARATVPCQPPPDAPHAQPCGGPRLDRVPNSGKVLHKLK